MSKKRHCQHFKPKGSGSGNGGGSDSGGGSGSCPNIGRNEYDVDFGMHTNVDSESEENTMNNEILYAINLENSNDSDAKPV